MHKKTNISLGRDVINLTSSKVITMIISMVSAMLLSRFRTLEEYGTYSQILMIINLVTALLMLGLPNSINYFLAQAKTEEEKTRFLSTYYTLSTLLSVIVGLILVLSAPLIVMYFDNILLKNFIYFLALYPWAKIIGASIENVLIVVGKTTWLIIFRVLNSISLLLIILFVQLLELTFADYMLLFLIVEAFFACCVYIIIKEIFKGFNFFINIALMKNILYFSIPIGLASVVGSINNSLDQLMIGKFYNTEQLAVYANAGKELPVTIIATSLTAVLLPKLVRLVKEKEFQQAIKLWGDSIILSYIIISFFAVGFITFAPDVMTILYSEKYLEGLSVFRIYNLVLLLRCTYFGMILNASGKTKFIFYSSIGSLALNISLNYILYKLIGFSGPAIATLASQLIINIIQLIYTAKTTGINFSAIFPWKYISLISVVNILLGISFYLIKIILPLENTTNEFIESILLGGIWGIIYLYILRNEIKTRWFSLNVNSHTNDIVK